MAFGTKEDLLKRNYEEQEIKRKKLQRDIKFRKFDRATQKFGTVASRAEQSFNTLERAGGKIFSGVRARMPRITPTGNSSREVLEDAFKLDTDITRRRQF